MATCCEPGEVLPLATPIFFTGFKYSAQFSIELSLFHCVADFLRAEN